MKRLSTTLSLVDRELWVCWGERGWPKDTGICAEPRKLKLNRKAKPVGDT